MRKVKTDIPGYLSIALILGRLPEADLGRSQVAPHSNPGGQALDGALEQRQEGLVRDVAARDRRSKSSFYHRIKK